MLTLFSSNLYSCEYFIQSLCKAGPKSLPITFCYFIILQLNMPWMTFQSHFPKTEWITVLVILVVDSILHLNVQISDFSIICSIKHCLNKCPAFANFIIQENQLPKIWQDKKRNPPSCISLVYMLKQSVIIWMFILRQVLIKTTEMSTDLGKCESDWNEYYHQF